MASMIDGESYLGRVLIRPISESKDVTMYCWPLRCLKTKMGGPTFGVDVQGVEIIRFDSHGPRGHWHKGGYDKLGSRRLASGLPSGHGRYVRATVMVAGAGQAAGSAVAR